MTDKLQQFADLHRGGDPLLLYNIWDAGSARAVVRAGAKAIATGSLSLAGAQGYADGEVLPLADLLATVRRIVASVDCPVSVDFEGGYAADPVRLGENAANLAATGAIGCNLEDQRIGADGLFPIALQAQRIAATASPELFVNARTDLFLAPLMSGGNPDNPEFLPEAIERAIAYAEAGARCFFVPGLADRDLIARLCEAAPLPVNVMMRAGMPEIGDLAQAGVARISWGPAPWLEAMQAVEQAAAEVYGVDGD